MNAYFCRKQQGKHGFATPENPQRFEEAEEYLTAKIKSIPKGKSFIFITDTHNRSGNAEQSPTLIGYIRELTDAKKLIMDGDILDREQNSDLAVQELRKYINRLTDIAGKDLLMVFGNHDLNTANSPEDMVTEHRIPYTGKVRYIIVETGNQLEFGRNGCVTKYFDVYNNEDLVMQYDWV